MMKGTARLLCLAAGMLALAACQTSGGDFPVAPDSAGLPNTNAPDAMQRANCPETLAFVRPLLVTPPDAEIRQALEKSMQKPVADMIKGSLEESIQNARRQAAALKAELARSEEVRQGYRQMGMTDAWVDMQLLAIQDGITINEAFADAAECRRSTVFERRPRR